jgi:release factor glutamine methyltransferase
MQNPEPPKPPEWTILKLLEWTTHYFSSRNIDSPRTDAEVLLACVLDATRIDLYTHYDQPLSAAELQQFKKLIQRRAVREPVAYITQTKEFWARDLRVSPDVLIPRPETEFLVERALAAMSGFTDTADRCILDLGTGSGAIVIALASEQRRHRYFASDISLPALRVARENSRFHGLERTIHFLAGNWFRPFKPAACRFDMIVSNPPYIRRGLIDHLQPEISKYEPRRALNGGKNGLESLERIICDAPAYMTDKGILLLEMGYDQKEAVAGIAAACGRYDRPGFFKDYAGHDRVVEIRKTG